MLSSGNGLMHTQKVSTRVGLCIGRTGPKPFAINPQPDYKTLDWSKLKQIADDILKWI